MLMSVLQSAGLRPDAKHVWFEGHDDVDHAGHTVKFGGSIPLEKLSLKNDPAPTLLAHRMNGATLLVEHGFPLRTVVPGYIGARSVKWLAKIVVSDRPSPNPFVAESYKVIKTTDPQEAAKAEPIYQNVINGAIAAPMEKVAAGKVKITGYALPSGSADAKVKAVEVSPDGGKNWIAARLDSGTAPYCWQLWYADLDLKPGQHTILARANDTTGAAMPEKSPWNAKGYLYNGWHRIEIEAV
jgi:sulfite oxidase